MFQTDPMSHSDKQIPQAGQSPREVRRPTVLELRNVSCAYGTDQPAITGISFAAQEGEIVCLLGPSGCGKTTTLRAIAGFEPVTAGEIRLEGRLVSTPGQLVPTEQRRIGMVFQEYALFPHLRVRDNVAFGLRHLSGDERASQVRLMLEMVGLTGLAARYPHELSGGQQQRVALARALVFEPRALLLDEPLSALDAGLRVAMRDEIRRVQREAGIATIHVTHDQEEALSIADRVAVMSEGEIVQVGRPDEVYDRPRTRFVARFVGQANFWQGTVCGAYEVDTPIGRLGHRQEGARAGDKVLVLVRPERLDLYFEDRETPPPNYFKGQVTQDRFLGSIRRFDFAVEGHVIRVETRDRAAPKAVAIPPDAVRLLPPDDNETNKGDVI